MKVTMLLLAASFTMAMPAFANEITLETPSSETSSEELLLVNKSVASDLGGEITPDQTVFNTNPEQPDFNRENNRQLSQGFGSLYTRTSAWYVGGSLGAIFPGNVNFDGAHAWKDYGDFVNDPGLKEGFTTSEIPRSDGTTYQEIVPEAYKSQIQEFDFTAAVGSSFVMTSEMPVDEQGNFIPYTSSTASQQASFLTSGGDPNTLTFDRDVIPIDHDGDGQPTYKFENNTTKITGADDPDNDGDKVDNTKDLIFGNQFTDKEIEDVLSTGFGGSIFGGYEFNKQWAVDLEVALQGGGLTDEGKKDYNSNQAFINQYYGQENGLQEDEGTQNYFVSAITINPRFTIPLGETETKPAKWSIFISPGIGLGTYSWQQGVATISGINERTGELVVGEVVDYNLSKTSVAFQVKAGAAYRFNYGFEVFGQLRYLVIPDVIQYTKDDLSIDSKTYSAFSPEVGLRFRF